MDERRPGRAETGPEVRKIHRGERVVVSSIIGCGQCWHCRNQEFSFCDNSNPNGWMQEKLFNYASAGIFGYSHMFGGYAGAQAEYIRVPFADVGTFRVPDGMSDDQALACSDAFPTGYMGADICDIKSGDIVAVWGCEVDPAFVFSHRLPLTDAPRAYTMFRDKHDDCLKLALQV